MGLCNRWAVGLPLFCLAFAGSASPVLADTFSVNAAGGSVQSATGPGTITLQFDFPAGQWSGSAHLYVGTSMDYSWDGVTVLHVSNSTITSPPLSGGGSRVSVPLRIVSTGSYSLQGIVVNGTGTPTPPVTPVVPVTPAVGAPCTTAYAPSVASYLSGAPTPCQYFDASQGFNASSAPLILAVLGVLVVILAIWMGHESVMSLFKRLLSNFSS